MDSILEYLPFIIAILYFVFGRKKKDVKQKPKRQQRKPSNPTTTTPSLDDILKELRGEVAKAVPKKMPPPTPVESENPKIDIVDHQYDFRPEYEHHADTGPSIEDIHEEIDEDRVVGTSIINASEIDARQLIIMDAILNPPYKY